MKKKNKKKETISDFLENSTPEERKAYFDPTDYMIAKDWNKLAYLFTIWVIWYFPEYLNFKDSKTHRKIKKALVAMLDRNNNELAIISFREFAKTSLVKLFFTYLIVYRLKKLFVIASKFPKNATNISTDIYNNLNRERINLDYGYFFEAKKKGKKSSEKYNDFKTITGTTVIAVSILTPVKGLLEANDRIDVVYLDDIENLKSADSSADIKTIRTNVSELLGGVDERNPIKILTGNRSRDKGNVEYYLNSWEKTFTIPIYSGDLPEVDKLFNTIKSLEKKEKENLALINKISSEIKSTKDLSEKVAKNKQRGIFKRDLTSVRKEIKKTLIKLDEVGVITWRDKHVWTEKQADEVYNATGKEVIPIQRLRRLKTFEQDFLAIAKSRGAKEFRKEDVDKCYFPLDPMETTSKGLNIFFKPEKGAKYIAGSDTSEGVGLDSNSDVILKVRSDGKLEEVASYENNLIYGTRFAKLLVNWGKYYNKAFRTIELNNTGHAVLPHMIENYPLYQLHKKKDKEKDGSPESVRYGFNTTAGSKFMLIDELDDWLSAGNLIIHSRKLYNELIDYTKDQKSKSSKAVDTDEEDMTNHYDLLDGLALAIQGRKYTRATPKGAYRK